MASHDVRDVLNLPQDGTGPRPSKKAKTGAARPNLKGLAREVQNLGGDNPIAIVPQVSLFKKRRFANRKPAARWELRPFKNSARGDDGSLILRHWRRQAEVENQKRGDGDGEDHGAGENALVQGAPGSAEAPQTNEPQQQQQQQQQIEDSAFAHYNVHVDVPQYSEDQYNSNLQNADWSKDETDYLLDLVRGLDLRWPLIWDRYEYRLPSPDPGDVGEGNSAVIVAPKPRAMEDLKARYYEVAAKMMAVQKPVQYMTQPEYALHEMMIKFSPQQEKLRKEFAINIMSRSKEEAREEESLLLEVRRIQARTDKMNEERHELYSRLDYPHTDQDISAFKSSAGLHTLLQNLIGQNKSNKRKSLLAAEGVSPGSGGPGQASNAGDGARRDSIAAAPAGHRESLGGDKSAVDMPKNNKKGAQHAERRKLSEQEEQVYGVSRHDRLTSGPTFRTEKVNKLFTQKSGQQQLRITNMLNELEMPARLFMPTSSISAQYEQLLAVVNQLVDLRRAADKIDIEIKIEEQRKLEREKAKGILGQVDGATDDPPKESEEAAAPTGADASEAATTSRNPSSADAKQHAESSGDIAAAAEPEAGATQPAANGDAPIKEDETEKSARPGSSGAHKRSASVLSTTSDKSSKRQKK